MNNGNTTFVIRRSKVAVLIRQGIVCLCADSLATQFPSESAARSAALQHCIKNASVHSIPPVGADVRRLTPTLDQSLVTSAPTPPARLTFLKPIQHV